MTEQTTGQRIAQCRKQLNLSQEGLGEKVGVSRQAISKWEADAALPDIDKLITLSRLFQVSVGWLLGVEELPAPQPESPPISEELLHKIEEVVKRYQPRKKPISTGKKILIFLLAAVVLWMSHTAWKKRDVESSMLMFTYAQVDAINEQNANILGQLNALEDRIDSINDTIEREGAVLAAYEFQITAAPGEETAFVYLNAVPKTWNKSWTATLSVRYDGSESMRQTCAWDGSALVSSLKLNLLDGYECWMVISYPDGSQEQMRLQDPTVEALKRATTITCDILPGHWSWYSTRQKFSLADYSLYLAQPTAMEESRWVRADFMLYHIRDSKRTVADIYTLMDEHLETSLEFWTDAAMEMTIPEVEPNDRLELWFEAELENGMTCLVKADSWIFQQGQFIWELESQ